MLTVIIICQLYFESLGLFQREREALKERLLEQYKVFIMMISSVFDYLYCLNMPHQLINTTQSFKVWSLHFDFCYVIKSFNL